MGLLIAVLLTLAVLGSIMWVMPSAREKMIINMRQKAMAAGVKVRLLDSAMAGKLFPWIEDHRLWVLYEMYVQDKNNASSKVAKKETRVIRLSDDFEPHELDLVDQLYDQLKQLKQDMAEGVEIEAVAIFSGCVSVLWRERGVEENAEKTLAFLKASAALIV